MPAPAYYITYTPEAFPEARTDAQIISLLERMTYSDLPGFVVRAAGQHPKQASSRMQDMTKGTPFSLSRLTIYSGRTAVPSVESGDQPNVRFPERHTAYYGPPTLQGLFVQTGALAVESFQPGPEVEAAFCLGFPVSLPDKEQYALNRRLINPAWLRSDGIMSTTLYPQDLSIYRPGSAITTAHPVHHTVSAAVSSITPSRRLTGSAAA